MATCEDLRLGGVLDTDDGILGGTSINGTLYAVEDWSGIFAHGGISYTPVEVSGRPGGFVVGDGLGRARYPNLNLRIKSQVECDSLEDPPEVLQANTDDLLTLLADPNGNYLEVDLPDGTSRFILVHAITPAPISQPAKVRRINVQLYSPDTYWRQGGAAEQETIVGVDTMTVGGKVNVYDPILVFAGDGTFTHLDADWQITVDGSVGPVVVDFGERTMTDGFGAADQYVTITNRLWGWFTPGVNNVDSDVSVVVFWRNQYN